MQRAGYQRKRSHDDPVGPSRKDQGLAGIEAGQRADEGDVAVKIAALLPAIAWAPFFLALATPGTAVEDEPGHLARVAGVPANLVPATLIPIISALGYTLHRHGR